METIVHDRLPNSTPSVRGYIERQVSQGLERHAAGLRCLHVTAMLDDLRGKHFIELELTRMDGSSYRITAQRASLIGALSAVIDNAKFELGHGAAA